jgi:hypothetical protein
MKIKTPIRSKYIAFKGEHAYRRYVQKEGSEIQHGEQETATHELPIHGSYAALLFDPRWKQKRAQILLRDANRCVICGSEQNLQVHHRQYHFIRKTNEYKPPWDYGDHLLISLCESCHGRGHSKFKVPTITILINQ